MTSDHRGACPSCTADVTLRTPLPSEGTCGACGQRFLVLVPAPDRAAGDGDAELQLLPIVRAHGSAPLPRPLWQLGRLSLLAGAALALAFVLAMVLVIVDSDEPSSISIRVLLEMLQLLLVAAFGTGVLWVLLGAQERANPRFDAARSALVLATGFAATLAVGWLATLVRRGMDEHVSQQAFAIVTLVLMGLLAGWCTARFASPAPIRHALALALAYALAAACLGMFTGPRAMLTLGTLSLVSYSPMVLAGAWLCVRFRRSPLPPGSSSASSAA